MPFDGSTYDRQLDFTRLKTLLERVRAYMSDGEWGGRCLRSSCAAAGLRLLSLPAYAIYARRSSEVCWSRVGAPRFLDYGDTAFSRSRRARWKWSIEMNLALAVDLLEELGCGSDPITWRGEGMTVTDLEFHLGALQDAAEVRITYYGREPGRDVHGTLSGMLTDRRKLADRELNRVVRSVTRCPFCNSSRGSF